MTAVIIGITVAILICSAIGEAFGVGWFGGLLIILGVACVGGFFVYLTNKNAKKNPGIAVFFADFGKFFFGGSALVGLVLTVIGFFQEAGSEVRTYHKVEKVGGTWVGYDVSYLADAISSLLYVGIFITVAGVILLICSFLIEEPEQNDIMKHSFEKKNAYALRTIEDLYNKKLLTTEQYTAKKQEIEGRIFR